MQVFGRLLAAAIVLYPLAACTVAPRTDVGSTADKVDAHFDSLKASPARLTAFLRAMPKGGDLHSHLSGAIYAESYIAWAIEDGLCLVVATSTIATAPCDPGAGKPLLADVVKEGAAYNALIDALSVRNYERRAVSGHDQFFATFARFGAAGDQRRADMLVETMTRAADQNILYLELMTSPGMAKARQLGRSIGPDDDPERFLARLRAAGLDSVAREAAAEFAAAEKQARALMKCASQKAAPACAVTVRYIAQIVRVFPRDQVFAEIALGFLLASQNPHVVGLNLVAPEDDRTSLADYSAHMRMIGALRRQFPDVGITLHAGELTLGLVPPEELRFHIAEAVRVAGASRIGHGVDILYEDAPEALLAEMAERQVLVEINLTSNDVILGVTGADHPFETYRAFGVPLALSSDDEGVSRIDLTHEYRRAVLTYDLSYADVKRLSRNSLTYAFLDGPGLWADPAHAVPVAACHGDAMGSPAPSPTCMAFLQTSAKATLQWALETRYRRFERSTIAAGH